MICQPTDRHVDSLVRTKFDMYVFIMMYKQMYSPQCMMFDTSVYRIAVARIRTPKD
jgi:hypothetical protein